MSALASSVPLAASTPTLSLPDAPPPPWCALRVKPQHENTAHLALTNKGLNTYLPQYRSRRQWSDRHKELLLPLFPGYLFCRLAPQDKLRVETTPSVLAIVGCAGRLAPIPEAEILAVHTMLASGLPVAPYPYLKEGDPVYIEHGPLRGLEGILLQVKNHWRVVVSVTLLQRSVAVEVDRELISPCSRFRPLHLSGARGAYA